MGSGLFEEITGLPEYYLTRTERGILREHAGEILAAVPGAVTIAELGAGTATKTGILLRAATERQGRLLYQPIDVSSTCLDEARVSLEGAIAHLTVRPQLANYLTDAIRLERPVGARILALYIGSSIGNFSPEEGLGILRNLRTHLEPGDALLLGTDLAPGASKSVASLLRAYDDAAGVTAAFNRNVLTRLNRDLQADFDVSCFRHVARWNADASRVEMHLESLCSQVVRIPANSAGAEMMVQFSPGETIHTENSYKFTEGALRGLLDGAGFAPVQTFGDERGLFAVTLAAVI